MITLVAQLVLSSVFAAAVAPADRESLSIYVENDSRNIGGPGSDRAYSNGFKFSYVYAEDRPPKWSQTFVKGLPPVLRKEISQSKVNFGFSLAHQIYTPNNTSIQTFIPDDRPYAGWAYLGFGVSFKKKDVGHFLELDLGLIGSFAYGEEVQNNFHDLIREPRTEGWAHSLGDEPTVQLHYQTRFRAYYRKYFDFVPYYGAALGNVFIGGSAGGVMRVGINLPDDFGPSRPSANDGDSFVSPTETSPSKGGTYYLFFGGRGNVWGRNLFLDGNTLRPSHRVTKYPITSEAEIGFGAQVDPIGIVWRFVVRSPEFEQRSNVNSFASLNFSYLL